LQQNRAAAHFIGGPTLQNHARLEHAEFALLNSVNHGLPRLIQAATKYHQILDPLKTAQWSLHCPLARAILAQPGWLFLDGGTSALDSKSEQTIYENLKERLPNTTLISIAHRDAVKRYHDKQLRFEPGTKSLMLDKLQPA